ncbi:MAG: EF-hand domain-containing protein [Pseudomonadota bacterium]
MRYRIINLAAGVACLAFAAGSAADNRERKFPISLAEVENRAAEHFAQMDGDGSGTINIDEFMAFEHPRAGMRKGAMGQRNQARRGGPRIGPRLSPEARAERKEQVEDEVFRLLDADGDGAVSAAEFADADRRAIRKQARKRVRFATLDDNGDGTLSADELPNPAARMAGMDTDGDGLITRAEMRSAREAWREKQRQMRNG